MENLLFFGVPILKHISSYVPDELGDYIKSLQALVEETYYTNYNTKVVLIGHSMGNPMTLYLLNNMTKIWKNKFIQSFISLAGVWGGAMKPIRLMISGKFLSKQQLPKCETTLTPKAPHKNCCRRHFNF